MERERFATCVAPHTPAMARVATALVGAADAEDAAQEALVRAWNGWPELREPAAARAWLLCITVNVCGNWAAGHFGTHRRATESLDAVFDAGTFPPAASSELGTARHAAALDLRRAIANLDEDLRYVVALRFYAGMDATEIGTLMDAPPATIRTRLRRALALLRDQLSGTPDISATSRQAGGH